MACCNSFKRGCPDSGSSKQQQQQQQQKSRGFQTTSWALFASMQTLALSGGLAETMQSWIHLFPPSVYLNLGTVDCIHYFSAFLPPVDVI